jgi:RNA polymerase sigma-70 factor, ECF subfamily
MDDTTEFEQVALKHLEAVYRVAVALGGVGLAEDLTQVTFTKAWKRFETFRRGTSCKAWLFQILRNTWIDELRHLRVAGTHLPLDEDLIPEPKSPETTAWTDAEDLLDNFSDEQVIAALSGLPPDQRLALYLVDVERLPLAQIAEITGVAIGTVKSRAGRGRAKLRRDLQKLAADLGLTGRRR